MAFERILNNIDRIKRSIRSLGGISAEYYKLVLFDKGMKVGIGLINGLILGFFGLFLISFLSLAVSIWLSTVIGIPSSGFFIVAGFYLFLFCCMLLFGKKMVERTVLVKVSRKIFNDISEEGNQNGNSDEAV